jgi:hypothetical protein
MIITTDTTEVGLCLRKDGTYELALYNRPANRLIRFPVDPALAWAIGASAKVPLTAEPMDAEIDT